MQTVRTSLWEEDDGTLRGTRGPVHWIPDLPRPPWPRTLTRTTGSRPRVADVKGAKVTSILAFLERGVHLGLGSLEGAGRTNVCVPLLLPAKLVTGITKPESQGPPPELGHWHFLAG